MIAMPSKKAPIAFEDALKRHDEGNERWINAPDEDQSATDTIEGRLLIPPESVSKIQIKESEPEGLAAAVGWTRPVSLEVSSSVSVRGDLKDSSPMKQKTSIPIFNNSAILPGDVCPFRPISFN